MDSNFLAYMTPLRRKIVQNLDIWRAMDIKDLKWRISYPNSDRALRKVLLDLKKQNWLSSKKIGITGKDYYFLRKEIHTHMSESNGPVHEDFLYHDILTSKFLMGLESEFEIEKIRVAPATGDEFILAPDAILEVKFGEKFKQIAVEMELTRKSIKRYLTKFRAYDQSLEYDLVWYVFNDPSIYNSYKIRLNEDFKNLKNCKILLILNSTLNLCGVDLGQTEIYGFGEELFLNDLFLKRRPQAC